MITGKVQDISFRSLIENIAQLYDIRGYSFNDNDGSVKMVCCGENGTIADFLEEIRKIGTEKGILIDDIISDNIESNIYLPPRFQRLYSDELEDIGRKLDKGNELLAHIMANTSELPEIRTVLNSFVLEQLEHNQCMKEHNQRLEKILEKLAEK
ncbi:MAG: acylphosphatase [Candidatus Methanoperedens sp.]|nr:acylphosphatase [Candidatus Methanoperedens sp.]